MSNQRPSLTSGAKEALDKYIERLKFKVIHEAEKHTLKENRTEISESDISIGKKSIFEVSPSKRKWAIRIILSLMIVVLGIQLKALSELSGLSQSLTLRLHIPNIFGIVFVLILSYIFKEDWI